MKLRYSILAFFLFISSLALAQLDVEMLIQNVEATVNVLADDSLKGREAGTEEEKMARDYIISRFDEIGLKPYFEDGFIQEFDFVYGISYKDDAKLVIDDHAYEVDADYYPLQSSGSKSYSGELVYVGYGLMSKDGSTNDYRYLKDIKGKVFCMEMSVPGGAQNLEKYGEMADLDVKVENAISQGASGVVFLNNDTTFTDPRKMISNSSHTHPIPVLYLKASGLPDFTNKAFFPIQLNLDIKTIKKVGYNIAAMIDVGAEKSIVIGGHYDHLGMGGPSSRYRGDDPYVHNGADDNASGVAAIIELARYYNMAEQSEKLKYNIIIVAFSAEEKGLLGSHAFVNHERFAPEKTVAMFNFDMVGRLNEKDPVLTLIGTGTAKQWDEIIDKTEHNHFEIRKSPGGAGGSDHTKFYHKNIPVLFFFTGIHYDYHRPTDDVDLLNLEGEAYVIQYASALIDEVNGREGLLFTKTKSQMPGRHGQKYKVTLGIMPGYGQSDIKGVLVEATSDGRPAQKAGIKAGDVIVQMGQVEIGGMGDYMKALGKFNKGQKIKVKVIRDGNPMIFDVTL